MKYPFFSSFESSSDFLHVYKLFPFLSMENSRLPQDVTEQFLKNNSENFSLSCEFPMYTNCFLELEKLSEM